MHTTQAFIFELVQWWPLNLWGPFSFGCVVGWLTHSTLTDAERVDVKWLGAIVGVIGGAAVTAIFKREDLFATYSIGLSIMFFARAILVSSDIAGLWQRYVEKKRSQIDRSTAPRTQATKTASSASRSSQ